MTVPLITELVDSRAIAKITILLLTPNPNKIKDVNIILYITKAESAFVSKSEIDNFKLL